jgi:hypothetical protein
MPRNASRRTRKSKKSKMNGGYRLNIVNPNVAVRQKIQDYSKTYFNAQKQQQSQALASMKAAQTASKAASVSKPVLKGGRRKRITKKRRSK